MIDTDALKARLTRDKNNRRIEGRLCDFDVTMTQRNAGEAEELTVVTICDADAVRREPPWRTVSVNVYIEPAAKEFAETLIVDVEAPEITGHVAGGAKYNLSRARSSRSSGLPVEHIHSNARCAADEGKSGSNLANAGGCHPTPLASFGLLRLTIGCRREKTRARRGLATAL